MEPTREQWYRQRIAELEARLRRRDQRIAELQAFVADLKAQLARLVEQVAKLSKDSSNSSKPPSSDIVKPPKPSGGKLKIGAQPGHPRHARPPFAPDQVDRIERHTLKACPGCGGRLKLTDESGRGIQQAELVAKPVVVTEHRAASYRCGCCGKTHVAPLPEPVQRGGLLGERLTAMVGYMKGGCHCSHTTIQAFLSDVLGLEVCTGLLNKALGKVCASLETPYAQALESLPREPVLNVDETGHKDRGKAHWTWCFHAGGYTLFKIDRSRGSGVLKEVLGEVFKGVLGCDYYSAYRKDKADLGVTVQFCLAHLIRDVRYLTTLGDRVTRRYGHKLLKKFKRLFKVWHKRGSMAAARWDGAMDHARDDLLKAARRPPPRGEAKNIAERFKKHGGSYFTFIGREGVEPTNNAAERAIRHVVIDRKVTQGTRGNNGQRWCERIWTTLATCAQQRRSAFQFLTHAVHAHFNHQPAPRLLPVNA